MEFLIRNAVVVSPAHVDDLDLVTVGQPDDLLVQVEEDVLRLSLAVQGLVGQAGTDMC